MTLALTLMMGLSLAWLITFAKRFLQIESTSLLGSLICAARGHCEPMRAGAMGGFRCTICLAAGDSLDDFLGFRGQGYVSGMRTSYSRAGAGEPGSGETTREIR